MSRVLVIPVLATIVIWLVLYLFVTGESTGLNKAIAAGIVVCNLAFIAHLFADRGLLLWTVYGVGVLLSAFGWVFLFSRFEYGWQFGRLDSGVSEGWYDLVRACAVTSVILSVAALIWHRVRERNKPTIPDGLMAGPEPTYRRRADDWKEAQ